MSISNLKDGIDQARRDLAWVYDAVAQVRATGTLSEESYAFFESFSGLCRQLEDASGLLTLREMALSLAKSFPERRSPRSPDKYLYDTVEVTFQQGRYLLVQSYLSTTWAL